MLQTHQIESDGAANGKEAVEKVKASVKCCAYKAIFMDVNMPVMDGIAATKEIIKFYSSLNAAEPNPAKHLTLPKIVALTANDTSDERARCLASGMATFLSKPCE